MPHPHSITTKQALGVLDVLTSDVSSGQRKASYYTINATQLLELAIGQGEEAWAALDRLARADQLHAFLFITRAPLREVSRGVRQFVRDRDEVHEATGLPVRTREEAWEEFAIGFLDPFIAGISPEALLETYEEIEKLNDHVPVEGTPPNHGGKPEAPDPNA